MVTLEVTNENPLVLEGNSDCANTNHWIIQINDSILNPHFKRPFIIGDIVKLDKPFQKKKNYDLLCRLTITNIVEYENGLYIIEEDESNNTLMVCLFYKRKNNSFRIGQKITACIRFE